MYINITIHLYLQIILLKPYSMDTLLLTCILICFSVHASHQLQSPSTNRDILQLRAALLLEEKNTSIYDEIHFRPAFDIALSKVNAIASQMAIPFNISYTFYSTGAGCGSRGMTAAALAANMLINEQVDVIFGPMCNDETVTVADLAANFEVPIFAASGTHPELLNKNRFKTFISMSHTRDVAANFVRQIFLRFNWKICAILWIQTQSYQRKLVDELEDGLRKYFITVNTVQLTQNMTIRGELIEARRRARSKYNTTIPSRFKLYNLSFLCTISVLHVVSSITHFYCSNECGILENQTFSEWKFAVENQIYP